MSKENEVLLMLRRQRFVQRLPLCKITANCVFELLLKSSKIDQNLIEYDIFVRCRAMNLNCLKFDDKRSVHQ